MRIRCDTKAFREVFGLVGQIAPAGSPVEAIQSVKLAVAADGAARLTATNLECWAVGSVGGVEVERPGEVLVPREYCDGILKTTDDPTLTLELDGDKLHVRSGRSKWVMGVRPVHEFRDIPVVAADPTLTVDADALARCLRRTAYIPSDAVLKGWVLGGLLLEWGDGQMAMVACDGKRMGRQTAAATVSGSPPPSAHGPMITPKVAGLLGRLLEPGAGDVRVAFPVPPGAREASMVTFAVGATLVAARLMEGRFPPYRAGMTHQPTHRFTLPLAPLRRAVDQVSVAATETTRRVDLRFDADGLTVVLPDTGLAEADAHVDAPFQGSPVGSSFDHRYLVAPLRAVDADAVDIEICGEGGPLICRADGFEYIVLSMSVGG